MAKADASNSGAPAPCRHSTRHASLEQRLPGKLGHDVLRHTQADAFGRADFPTSTKAIGLLAYLSAHELPPLATTRTSSRLALARESDSAGSCEPLRSTLWWLRDMFGPDVLAGHETLALSDEAHESEYSASSCAHSVTRSKREASRRERD